MEVSVSTLLVGLVLVTAMKMVGGVIRTWQVTETQHDGMALAVELMTEVQQARYIEPIDTAAFGREGAESSSNRRLWDDTDDYDNWSASPPQAKDGTALTDYKGWTRTVNVQKVNAGDPGTVRSDGFSDTGLRKLTVTVTSPDGRQTVLIGLRDTAGVMEQDPMIVTRYVTWVGSDLEVGKGSAPVRSGTNITNHALEH